MADPRGIAIARELATTCDAITENFSAGVLKRWGMDRDRWRPPTPASRSSRWGAWARPALEELRHVRADDPCALRAHLSDESERGNPSGLRLLAHRPPQRSSGGGGRSGGRGARRRTGQGLDIDLSQYELGLGLMGPALIDHLANGVDTKLRGTVTRSRRGRRTASTPRPARMPGWPSPSSGDDQWRAFCGAIGRVELATDPRFATHEARLANQDALDRAVADWTGGHDRYEVLASARPRASPLGRSRTRRT